MRRRRRRIDVLETLERRRVSTGLQLPDVRRRRVLSWVLLTERRETKFTNLGVSHTSIFACNTS